MKAYHWFALAVVSALAGSVAIAFGEGNIWAGLMSLWVVFMTIGTILFIEFKKR